MATKEHGLGHWEEAVLLNKLIVFLPSSLKRKRAAHTSSFAVLSWPAPLTSALGVVKSL